MSVVVTVLNEEGTIERLLGSLLRQSHKADEIIIVDAGSTDGTIEKVQNIKFKNQKIKIIVREGVSRAEGRNIGIKAARNEIIALTDAGCVARKDWLEKLISGFRSGGVGVVAGFYDMVGSSTFQKAESCFLGVLPQDFSSLFLPSTRSMALRKSIWEKLGGFSKNLKDTAEDTMFNFKAIQAGVEFTRVKSARVEWRMPETFIEFIKKIYGYAKGDAQTKVIWNNKKRLSSHNIKVIFVFLRYILGLCLLAASFRYTTSLLFLLFLLIIFYLGFSFYKVFRKTGSWGSGLWGIVLQLVSDFAVMSGFARGII